MQTRNHMRFKSIGSQKKMECSYSESQMKLGPKKFVSLFLDVVTHHRQVAVIEEPTNDLQQEDQKIKLKKGWLSKKSPVLKNWQYRFFVLSFHGKKKTLEYYETEDETKL